MRPRGPDPATGAGPWGRIGKGVALAALATVAALGAWGCTREWMTTRMERPVTVGADYSKPQYLDEKLAIRIRGHALEAEVARRPHERNLGLMHRPPLPDGGAMLFVYPDSDVREFWMKNTPSPLSIAFIDDDGLIVSVRDMVPWSEETVGSAHPVRLALEVRRGLFDRIGARAGDRVEWERDPFLEPPPDSRTD